MSIQKTVNLLSFDELNKDQQDKVVENYADINTDYDWFDYTIEEWQERLTRQGFTSPKINFSGFFSQGDGASFNCIVDLPIFLKGRRALSRFAKDLKQYNEEGGTIKITNQGYYCHEYTMAIDSQLSQELDNYILEEARNQARKIYKELEAEYYALQSREEIVNTLKANEYLFNETTLKIDTI